MLVLGADAHKRTHTVVAVDAVGKQVGHTCQRANDEGHRELIDWGLAERMTVRACGRWRTVVTGPAGWNVR